MSRAGREPAEDVKRRIVAACQEAGLTVLSARMYLSDDELDRMILVNAARPERPYQHCAVGIMASVMVGGTWSRELDVRCAAWDKDDLPNVWETPVMCGRGAVPLEDMVVALTKTVEEQEQVIAAMRMGVQGPYSFAETTWEKPPVPLGPFGSTSDNTPTLF